MRGNWALNELHPSILQFWRTPKQKPSRKRTVSQLAPVKQAKFLEKNTTPLPHLIKHMRNICVHQAPGPRFIPLFPPHENSVRLSQGQPRLSATPLSSMVSNYLTSAFFLGTVASCFWRFLTLEWNSSPFFLQDETILQERIQQLKTPSMPAHFFQAFTPGLHGNAPSILTISRLRPFSLLWSASRLTAASGC